MKFFIFIFVVGFLSVESALVCVSSSNLPTLPAVPPTNVTCTADVKYCMSVDVKYKGSEFKYQTCNGALLIDVPGLPKTCTATGRTTMDATNTTGEYDCCDKDYCNNGISLNADKTTSSAVKPFAFGFASLFVILALLF
uniref:Uncharacterized protein n=1 Tax=Panagrolaimus davidi TaxID=227884 RepID=A0A914Q653_9BILA